MLSEMKESYKERRERIHLGSEFGGRRERRRSKRRQGYRWAVGLSFEKRQSGRQLQETHPRRSRWGHRIWRHRRPAAARRLVFLAPDRLAEIVIVVPWFDGGWQITRN